MYQKSNQTNQPHIFYFFLLSGDEVNQLSRLLLNDLPFHDVIYGCPFGALNNTHSSLFEIHPDCLIVSKNWFLTLEVGNKFERSTVRTLPYSLKFLKVFFFLIWNVKGAFFWHFHGCAKGIKKPHKSFICRVLKKACLKSSSFILYHSGNWMIFFQGLLFSLNFCW